MTEEKKYHVRLTISTWFSSGRLYVDKIGGVEIDQLNSCGPHLS